MLEEKSHLPAVLQSLGCIAQAAMPVFETRESEVEKFIKENILELGHVTVAKSTGGWDDVSELCSLKIFGVKALVKSYLPVKDAHLRSRIDDIIGILKNILLFGDISRETESSVVDRARLKLAAAKAVLRLSKIWEHKIPIDVLYLALRTSEENFPEVKKLLLHKVHQYVRDRILDPKFACAFLLNISASQSDLEENKCCLNDIIQMCRQGRGRQISLQTDAMSPPSYPEYILPYVVHSLAHHPLFPDVDECKDVKIFEPIYRQLYVFLSMLVHGDADAKSDISMSKDKESISLLSSIFQRIRHSEDAFDAAKSKNLYALCDLGMPIIKRLAPDQDELQDSSVSVALPPVLYKPVEKKEENNLLVGEVKTWLGDEGILAHFESLELEAHGLVQSVTSEDDIMKDSETEGSEMPLRKLTKRLKAKATKTKKELKNEPAKVANENDFDILNMVKEINSDNQGTISKFESTNGHGYAPKSRRSNHELQKRKGEKRRRTSAQAQKSPGTVSSKSSKSPTNVSPMNVNVDFEIMNEEPQASSEDQHMRERTAEPSESDLLSSHIRKKSSSSSKHKRSDRNSGVALNNSPEAKKQNPKSISGLGKCTTKEKRSSIEDLIGCRIKVWWPMDKQYYEGIVKSFDTEKNKHVILYDDGDVEVLRLDRERWDLVDNGLQAKRSGSSKGFSSRGSSGQRRNSRGGPKQDKNSGAKSPSSQVKRNRAPRTSLKERLKIRLKSESFEESGESADTGRPVITTKLSVDSGSEKEPTKRIGKSLATKELSGKDHKQQEDVENVLSDAEEHRETEQDSENTKSENLGGSPYDPHRSDDEAVSSSDKQQTNETKEESGEDAGEADNIDSHATSLDKLDKKTSASDSVDIELSDDETLSMWKQRSGKK